MWYGITVQYLSRDNCKSEEDDDSYERHCKETIDDLGLSYRFKEKSKSLEYHRYIKTGDYILQGRVRTNYVFKIEFKSYSELYLAVMGLYYE